MAIRYLLDTSTVRFFVREPSAALRRHLERTHAEHVAVSVITEMEMRYGLARRPSARVAALVEEVLDSITILPLTSDAAKHYGRTRAALDAKGTPISPLDLMIAAHALSLGVTLVSNHLREFRRVPGLRCQDWTR